MGHPHERARREYTLWGALSSRLGKTAAAVVLAGVLLGHLTGVSFTQDPTNEQWTSYWQDCEDTTCFTDPITFSLNAQATFASVSGGVKIYQDDAQGITYDWATDPAEPSLISWAIGNYQSGSATWVGSNSNGQLTNGCAGGTVPSGDSIAPCQHSAYNTNGHVFSGSWYVNYAENVGSSWDYSSGTSIAQEYFTNTSGYSEPVN